MYYVSQIDLVFKFHTNSSKSGVKKFPVQLAGKSGPAVSHILRHVDKNKNLQIQNTCYKIPEKHLEIQNILTITKYKPSNTKYTHPKNTKCIPSNAKYTHTQIPNTHTHKYQIQAIKY